MHITCSVNVLLASSTADAGQALISLTISFRQQPWLASTVAELLSIYGLHCYLYQLRTECSSNHSQFAPHKCAVLQHHPALGYLVWHLLLFASWKAESVASQNGKTAAHKCIGPGAHTAVMLFQISFLCTQLRLMGLRYDLCEAYTSRI